MRLRILIEQNEELLNVELGVRNVELLRFAQ